MTDEAMLSVKEKIDGDGTKENGGYRAPGINIRYLTPEKIPINVSVRVYAKDDVTNELDKSAVMSDVETAVRKHINGLKIGRPVLSSDITVVLKRIRYLSGVKVVSPGYVPVANNQIARFESCEIEVIVV
jgi:uncharacterized phage protein gp47/JayE